MSYLFIVIGALLLFFLAVFWTVVVPYMDETTVTASSKAINYDLLDEKKLEELKARIDESSGKQKEKLSEQYDRYSELLELGFTKKKLLKGKKIYMREGCYFCHTMQVRGFEHIVKEEGTGGIKKEKLPIPADKFFASYGEPSQSGDYVYERPHLLGTERTGPDLFYEGLKRELNDPKDPNDPTMKFHIEHFKNPRSKEASSLMPSFDFLSDDELEALTLFISIPRE